MPLQDLYDIPCLVMRKELARMSSEKNLVFPEEIAGNVQESLMLWNSTSVHLDYNHIHLDYNPAFLKVRVP